MFLKQTLFLLLAASLASAAIVYQNGSPDLSNGYYYGGGSYELRMDFVLPQQTTLTGVNFWTLGAPFDTDWGIYADTGGSGPGSVLHSGTASPTMTDLGDPVYGLDPFHNFFAINVTLAAGTYWLGLEMDGQNGYAARNTSGPIGQESYFYNAGVFNWTTAYEWPFNLENQVPEPRTAALCGAGLLLLAGVLKRRRVN